ncbi:hypothetical protein SI65_03600 [Aspergillus cristatus]|uniref:Vacuolar segregation protein 7 n=1 Tax=Aspergillus cristatus TaxID=573508 RepID=A0A1E3BI05_ASPCR|nr:hypothetical protein SI65_03600 [Aspergillus cristatus]
MAEPERSPYRNGIVSGRSRLPKEEDEAAAGDMMEVPQSTAIKSQAKSPLLSQVPKISSTTTTPGVSAPPSTDTSTFSSREPSPVRTSLRAGTSNSISQLPPSSPRKNSQDRSPPRSTPDQNPGPASFTVQQTSSQAGKLPLLSPPSGTESSTNASSPDKSNMPAWATSRRPDQESTQPNTSSKRSSIPSPDDLAAKGDRSMPRTVNRGLNGSSSALETVQEMTSDHSSPSNGTILNQPLTEEPHLQKIDEDATPKANKQGVESGSESGGNKSSEPMDEKRGKSSTGAKGTGTIIPKRSTTSLSGNGARGKPTDGSVRNMIVETETVSSIPQVSLSAATGDRGHTGRIDPGTLRMKPSTETIRPKKEKKKARKPAPLPSGAASSKADIFEAKVASAVDEADVSDSDETFVYESNPPDPYPVRQSRYHSRTPSATSMASQADQFGSRARPTLPSANHSVTGKRSMKFTNNTYSNSLDGDAGDEGPSNARHDGPASHTRHHHIGRYGRNNLYPSIFDSDSPFPQSHSYIKSPRHFVGSGYRQSRQPGSRGVPNYRTMGHSKKAGDMYGYDYDAEGADDERTPLVGSPRMPRSRHGGRRPNSASVRQMEYMHRRRGYMSRYGLCAAIFLLLFLIIGGATSFIVAITKPLREVHVAAIQNVLASEQELMLDLNVRATNPNLFPVVVDDMDVNIFAKSRFVGTDKFWREHGSELDDFPPVEPRSSEDPSEQLVHVTDGVDHGTDPIPNDPVGDPQTMLLGRVFRFDSSLAFEPSPWNYLASSSKGQIRLPRPGNKTEEGGTERWERVLQHPFDLIVRGVIKYQLPLSSRFLSASVSSSVKVTPDKGDNNGGDPEHDPEHPPSNDTVKITSPRRLPRRYTFSERKDTINIFERPFTA